jgi:hypothetical protein
VRTSLVTSVRTGAGEPKTGMSLVESAVDVVAPSWVTYPKSFSVASSAVETVVGNTAPAASPIQARLTEVAWPAVAASTKPGVAAMLNS